LLGAGIMLVVAEIFAMTYGVLFVLGIACLLLGGSMVFDPSSVPEMGDLSLSFWSVLVPAVAAFALFGGLILFVVARSLGRPQITGVGELIGLVGKSVTPLAPDGRVFVRGEYWTARADEELPSGADVEVTAVEGMVLRVRRAVAER